MIRTRSVLFAAATMFAAAFCMPQAAWAQTATYPDRPIKLIVPFPPGGVNDVVARPIAERLKDTLGTVVIENRGGAGGTIGATAVARAEPDGYTILFGSGATHIIGPQIVPTRTYDPVKDFKPVAILTVSGLGIAVHPSMNVKTLKELIAHAAANKGKLSYASAGTGSATHLGAELFKTLIKDESIVHVPYKGGGPAMADLASGQVVLGVLNVTGSLLELHNSGKIRILAVTSEKRMSSAPNIPTGPEAGVSGLFAVNFAGLFVPAATPDAIVEKIAAAARKSMADPKLIEFYKKSGLEISEANTPAAAGQFVGNEIARWTPVMKAIGLGRKAK